MMQLGAESSPPNQQPKFDAHRLRTGRFEYRDSENGKELGTSRIVIADGPGSDTVTFSNLVRGTFSQRWQAVARFTFEPVSANLTFGEGPITPAFEISYKSGRVTGFVVERKGPNAGTKRAIDNSVGANVVDQRIDWAAVSASDFGAAPEFEFDVYDPGLGISHVLARRGPPQSVRVPAGQFEVYPITYEIRKRTGSEVYEVFVTKTEPRILVREDFPHGVESDLVLVFVDNRE